MSENILEVGTNGKGNVVINHPQLDVDENGCGHIVFSAYQARKLVDVLMKKANDADEELRQINIAKHSRKPLLKTPMHLPKYSTMGIIQDSNLSDDMKALMLLHFATHEDMKGQMYLRFSAKYMGFEDRCKRILMKEQGWKGKSRSYGEFAPTSHRRYISTQLWFDPIEMTERWVPFELAWKRCWRRLKGAEK